MKTINSNIKNSVVAGWGGPRLLTAGDVRIIKDGYYASEEFLEMFEFPLVSGTHSEALKDPMSIVLSESLAKILFGDEDSLSGGRLRSLVVIVELLIGLGFLDCLTCNNH